MRGHEGCGVGGGGGGGWFFFFKQKTAYEIVTCDWSSDVCSSDLFNIENTCSCNIEGVFTNIGLNPLFKNRSVSKLHTPFTT